MSWRREQELERVGIDEPDVRTILHLDNDVGTRAFSNRNYRTFHDNDVQ